ncbi:hydroxymethylbilane synthase [Mycoplasma sp. P36-A1]|uniref:hydroxymethylbilane synthase n=1 Tax=Mycoplasma sp. P36-A1 TaxID=3252900 RepID=UPI003C2AB6E1
MKTIVIGARASNLAMIQANIIKDELLAFNPNISVDIVSMTTKGDQRLDINWKTSNESLKGLFTTELEKALLENEIDIAVHSLKDMPTDFDKRLEIAAYLNQCDERDAFVSDKYNSIMDLPIGAVVGTSAIRRELQILQMRPDVTCKVIRGNVETRLNKMLSGEYDAIILAAAGLIRTNNTKYMKQCFNEDEMLSASGQGILCVQTRRDDFYIKELIKPMIDPNTRLKAIVERTFSRIFDGGCTTPMGCNATIDGDRITFKGMYYRDNIRYDGYVEGYTYENAAISYRLSNQIKKQYIKNPGKVYLVGSGPGDPSLLTIKAREVLEQADCVLYDRLVSEQVLSLVKDSAKLVYVGKESHEGGLSQALINEQIANAAFDHKIVVRLKSGDPFIFGRGYEEIQAISQYNINFEIVPGISSFIGASAYSGIPLTDRNNSSSIHVFSGHSKRQEADLDFATIAKLEGTLIFFMSIKSIKDIVENLIENGRSHEDPIAFIENATTNDQRVIISNFEQILHTNITTRIKAPAIIVMGDVVSLYEKATWFNTEQKLTLLCTREQIHFSSFETTAKEYGFNALSAPMINVIEIKDAVKDVNKYDIVLFNSANGVKYFIKQYGSNCIENVLIGAVGSKTKELLEELDIKVDIMPKVFNMDMLLEKVIEKYADKSILVINSNASKFDINKWQRRCDNIIEQLITYDTISVKSNETVLKNQIQHSNVITFFSASGVQSFLNNINYHSEILDSKKIASIGPFTTKALQDYGIVVDIEADVSTQEGLIHKIKEYYNV